MMLRKPKKCYHIYFFSWVGLENFNFSSDKWDLCHIMGIDLSSKIKWTKMLWQNGYWWWQWQYDVMCFLLPTSQNNKPKLVFHFFLIISSCLQCAFSTITIIVTWKLSSHENVGIFSDLRVLLGCYQKKSTLENKLALNDKNTKSNYNYCKMGFM